MSYVDSQLLPNETVLYRARLHRSLYTVPFIFVVLALVTMAFAIGQHPLWWGVLFFGVIAAVTFIWSWVRATSSEFAVTDKRVIIKVGWIRRRSLETLRAEVEGIA